MNYPKRQEYRNRKILDAARGEDCLLQIPGVCNNDTSTVIAAHSNFGEDGKGASQKADDIFVAFSCFRCHQWLDESHASIDEKYYLFNRGFKRTLRRLLDKWVLK